MDKSQKNKKEDSAFEEQVAILKLRLLSPKNREIFERAIDELLREQECEAKHENC